MKTNVKLKRRDREVKVNVEEEEDEVNILGKNINVFPTIRLINYWFSRQTDCLHVLFVSQSQPTDIVKNLQTEMHSFPAHMTVENHRIVKYGAMHDPAHSSTMFAHNATDWVTMRNIAVSANYENQLSWTNKFEEENDKLTQRRHSKFTKCHLFLNQPSSS